MLIIICQVLTKIPFRGLFCILDFHNQALVAYKIQDRIRRRTTVTAENCVWILDDEVVPDLEVLTLLSNSATRNDEAI
jgi:hypothetical protein